MAAAGFASDSSPGLALGAFGRSHTGPWRHPQRPRRLGCTTDERRDARRSRHCKGQCDDSTAAGCCPGRARRAAYNPFPKWIDPRASLTRAGIRVPCLSSSCPRGWGLFFLKICRCTDSQAQVARSAPWNCSRRQTHAGAPLDSTPDARVCCCSDSSSRPAYCHGHGQRLFGPYRRH